MPTPFPSQLTGAEFLSKRRNALLADAPRVGKTGAAIIASDYIMAERTLVITTASGRTVWARGLEDWSAFKRKTAVLYKGGLTKEHLTADRLIVGWPALHSCYEKLSAEMWDLLLPDESHYAKSIEAKRTQALYGRFSGQMRIAQDAISDAAAHVWCLSGTPIPNAPNDLFPMLRALCPERLSTVWGPSDVSAYSDFLHRYCIVRKKAISRWKKIDVVVGGKNLEELNARLKGFWMRRTQQDVGITAPIYEILPIHITDTQRKKLESEIEDAADILDAAETGETKSLELHMGPLRRLTGTIKAAGVIQAVKDEFESGLDKIVLMCWHKDTMASLEKGLFSYGVVRLDGNTSVTKRDEAQRLFQTDPNTRVFVGQITAAGEAIDLSAAAELIFVEMSFVPKDGAQAALRITNHGQKRQPRVRVAALEGSIDEAVQSVLTRKVKTITETMK